MLPFVDGLSNVLVSRGRGDAPASADGVGLMPHNHLMKTIVLFWTRVPQCVADAN
jgi:hypothetical protein